MNNKITKDIIIEDKNGKRLKIRVLEKRLHRNDGKIEAGDVISELLAKHKRKEINFESFELGKRVNRKVRLSLEAEEIYKSLPQGTKTYVVNGLLRKGVK